MATNPPTIPVIDLALLSDENKRPELMALLRHALINIGFIYLKNHPVPQELIDRLEDYIPRLFELPLEEKDKIPMINSPHFFGYSRFASEYTEGETDHREHFDFATPYVTRWKPGGPDHLAFYGPCQVYIQPYPEDMLHLIYCSGLTITFFPDSVKQWKPTLLKCTRPASSS